MEKAFILFLTFGTAVLQETKAGTNPTTRTTPTAGTTPRTGTPENGTILSATCGKFMRVYCDGVKIFDDDWANDTQSIWLRRKTTKLVLPPGTQVLGIECLVNVGSRGIIASTDDGVVTDGSWSCSANQNVEGWTEPGFLDSEGDFSSPSILWWRQDCYRVWRKKNEAYCIWTADMLSTWAGCKTNLSA
eukprot:GFUD01014794.1.p1 GENE.GFUD01014794.1~~GFUD01014794.1.p1  ORF type:complete len:189 (-),score=28.77 GFUD01014794.1:205-771(-)